ncbi:MAG: hypothetical protein PVG35_05930 [Desulfobacterales bacterium]|jgi:hypothetical protein
MRAQLILTIVTIVLGCAGSLPSDDARSVASRTHQTAPQAASNSSDLNKPIESTHGYIIEKDYELGRFGGFIGDCTDEQNWPYFWQCMSENSGNGNFH